MTTERDRRGMIMPVCSGWPPLFYFGCLQSEREEGREREKGLSLRAGKKVSDVCAATPMCRGEGDSLLQVIEGYKGFSGGECIIGGMRR